MVGVPISVPAEVRIKPLGKEPELTIDCKIRIIVFQCLNKTQNIPLYEMEPMLPAVTLNSDS
jgi:hypothetical protein